MLLIDRLNFGFKNITKDEGRPLGTGLQGLVSNHRKRRGLSVLIVSVTEKAWLRPRQVRIKETNVSEPLMKCREVINEIKTGRRSEGVCVVGDS